MMRRSSDRTKLVRSLFGAVIVLFAIVLKLRFPTTADWLIIALVLVGAGLVSPSFIRDLVKAWRGTPPPPTEGGHVP